ncbi:hypothetical protein K8R62_02815 [bacterium]|nr:hypothetical protein [bacterium]
MLSYLEKFENLPIDLRKKVSNKEIIDKISQLENKYGLDLVPLIIKIIIKEVPWNSLVYYLMEDFFVNIGVAEALKKDLADQVFYNIADYLGIETVEKEIENKKEAEVFLPKINKEKRLPAYNHKNDELNLVKIEKKEDLSSVFSNEEQKEIKEIASSMDRESGGGKNERNEEFNQILEKIIKESELNFSSQASEDRFRKILLTYLKGIRNKAKTKYALSKDFDKGGLGLGEKVVDNTVLLSDKYHELKNKEKENKELFDKPRMGKEDKTGQNKKDSIFDFDEEVNLGGPDLPSKNYYDKPDKSKKVAEKKKSLNLKDLPNRDIDYDLSSLKKSFNNLMKNKKKIEEREDDHDLEEVLKTRMEDNKEKKDGDGIQKVLKKENEKVLEKKENKDDKSIKGLKQKEKEGIIKNFSQEDDDIVKQDKKIKRGEDSIFGFKKKINDIKKPPKLLNPISELKYMDLFTFRRLGDNPRNRIEKIKEKISNLEKKFFYRKVQGVQAWRQSPVNRIYLNMGNESIVYSKSIDDIIKKREKEKNDYLEKDEFESIMDLNNDLKYY